MNDYNPIERVERALLQVVAHCGHCKGLTTETEKFLNALLLQCYRHAAEGLEAIRELTRERRI